MKKKKVNNKLTIIILLAVTLLGIIIGYALYRSKTLNVPRKEELLGDSAQICTCPSGYVGPYSPGNCFASPRAVSESICNNEEFGWYYNGTCYLERVSPTCQTESLILSPSTLSLEINKSATAVATYKSGSDTVSKNITWSSSNTSVATVSSNGTITGVGVGSATITAEATASNGTTKLSDSCSVTVSSSDVLVTRVDIVESSLSMVAGETEMLTVNITPNNATNTGLTWSSSNTSVATVSDGIVTARTAGSAVITATAKDGSGKSDSVTVTVSGNNSGDTVSVTDVIVSPSTLSLKINGTAGVTATVRPNEVSNKNVTWSSSNTSVATVSSSGTVTGVGEGSATITATSVADNSKFGTVSVTVTSESSNVLVTRVDIVESSLSMVAGETEMLTVNIMPNNATNTSLTWSSSNTSVATVSDGIVTAKAAGSAVITATAKDGSGKSDSVTVTVSSSIVAVTGVSITLPSMSMYVGDTATIVATVSPSDASNKELIWTSSDTDVASVNSAGVVTAKKAGTTVITATSKADNTKYDTITVTVLSSSNIQTKTTAIELNVGNQRDLYSTYCSDADYTNQDCTIDWKINSQSSSNVVRMATHSTYATITANAAGTATITATVDRDGVTTSIETWNVTVNAAEAILSSITSPNMSPTYYLALPASDSSAGSSISATYVAHDANNNRLSVDWSKRLVSGSTASVTSTDTNSEEKTYTFTATGSATASNCPVENVFEITGSKDGVTKNDTVTVMVYCRWTGNSANGKGRYQFGDGSRKSNRNEMRFSSGCYAYENAKEVDGKILYDSVYYRCCGTPTPIVNQTAACYGNATTLKTSTKLTWATASSETYPYKLENVLEDDCKLACYGDAATIASSTKVTWATTSSETYPYKLANIIEEKCKVTTPEPTYACYKNASDNYVWANDAPSSDYTIVDTIKNQDSCKKAEEAACYYGNGNYIWGLYESVSGYTKVSTVSSEADCALACYGNGTSLATSTDFIWSIASNASYPTKLTGVSRDDCAMACYGDSESILSSTKVIWASTSSTTYPYKLSGVANEKCQVTLPTPGYACYRDVNDNYTWATSAPSGYIKVDDIKNENYCKKPESLACYLNNGNYVWGLYEGISGYTKVLNIDSADACVAPEQPACYKDTNDNYVWGKYANNSNYLLVDTIVTKDNCVKVIVPNTASNISKLIYVFMLVFMAFGVGLLYWSYKHKKENNN